MKKKLRKADLEDAIQFVKTLGGLDKGKKYSLKGIAKIIRNENPNYFSESVENIETTLKKVNDKLELLFRGDPIGEYGDGNPTAYWYMRSQSEDGMKRLIEQYNARYYTPLTDKRFLPKPEDKNKSLDDF